MLIVRILLTAGHNVRWFVVQWGPDKRGGNYLNTFYLKKKMNNQSKESHSHYLIEVKEIRYFVCNRDTFLIHIVSKNLILKRTFTTKKYYICVSLAKSFIKCVRIFPITNSCINIERVDRRPNSISTRVTQTNLLALIFQSKPAGI